MESAAPQRPHSPAEPASCTICLEGADEHPAPLIQPCACTASSVHPACLERWLESRPQSDMKCEVCKATYRITLQETVELSWRRACSAESWRNYCDLIIIVLSSLGCAWAVWMAHLDVRRRRARGEEVSEWFMWLLTAGCACMLVATIRKICERLRTANSASRIAEGDVPLTTAPPRLSRAVAPADSL